MRTHSPLYRPHRVRSKPTGTCQPPIGVSFFSKLKTPADQNLLGHRMTEPVFFVFFF